MEQQTLKITSVLSDPTRFSIYQYITKKHRDVTVQEIAETFNIHANVARLHLTKLEDVNMLISETKKTGKGGRPSRLYRLSDEVINLQFPYRDYQRLSDICIETLLSLGEEGKKALNQVGKKYGLESSKEYVTKQNINLVDLSIKEKLEYVEQVALSQGVSPEIKYDEETNSINFRIYNCTFKELVNVYHGSLCKMHHSLLTGIFEYFLGEIRLKENYLMLDEKNNCCSYTGIFLENEMVK
ncbi:helix-turn-helix transcriptional regulator [Anaerobacillus sp. MEB173]|uniref:helix-turn-helix transcriptional regulator n=1 Tax=Anaerobacillus sp. MEB173 TaxID=3383345 RepID=UPI003F8FC4B4